MNSLSPRPLLSLLSAPALAMMVVCSGCSAETAPESPLAPGSGGVTGGSGGSSGAAAGAPSGGSGGLGSAGSPGASGGGGSGAGSGGVAGGGAGGSGVGGGGAGAGAAGVGGGTGGLGSGGAGGGGAAGGVGTGGTSGAGGASGAGGSGGSGGVPAFNPCPTNGDPCKIMPLGDSITDGAGSSANKPSYRYELFRLSLMAQKKLTFVGSAQNGPNTVDGVTFPKNHEGHSGWTIDDGGGRSGVYPKIENWLKATSPHVVTLMIGTNDVDIQLDTPNAPQRLGLLIDRITTTMPNALVVVAQIVPTTNDGKNQRVVTYNNAIPAVVKARADAGKHVTMVDMYGAFTKNASYKTAYMTDELHPNDAGYVVMANTWYAAIGSLLPPK